MSIATQTATLLMQAQLAQNSLRLLVRRTGLCTADSQGLPHDDGRYLIHRYRHGDEWQECQIPVEGWLSPFWKTVEEIGWHLTHKQRTGHESYTWVLAPMQILVAPGLPTKEELLGYVEKIRPMAGERAQRALAIALSGEVQQAGVDEAGKDRWQVAGSQTSLHRQH